MEKEWLIVFVGIKKNEQNKIAVDFMENMAKNYEEYQGRTIIFGSDNSGKTRLVEDFLTVLNSQGYNTLYVHVDEILNGEVIADARNFDLIAVDGLFSNLNYDGDQITNLHLFLNVHQHDNLLLTCPLSPDEVFSMKIKNYLDLRGITWSRTILGSRPLFMNSEERLRYLELLNLEKSSDYRLVQSREFLSKEIIPYNELKFLSKKVIEEVIKNGDDSKHNFLVITKDEEVRLLNYEEFRGNENIAVHLEGFMAGNSYVGKKPSKSLVSEWYGLLLEGYYSFLRTGEESYMDISFNRGMSNQDFITEIKKLKNYTV